MGSPNVVNALTKGTHPGRRLSEANPSMPVPDAKRSCRWPMRSSTAAATAAPTRSCTRYTFRQDVSPIVERATPSSARRRL